MPDESLASLLIDSVVDYAIFVLDAHGVVRTWNPGAERVKGYAPAEIIGRDFSVFYTEPDREAGLPSRLLAEAAARGRVSHTGWRVRKDGRLFYGDVTITALRDDDGELQGFAKVTRDRTDQHELEIAMAQSLDRERQSAQQLAEAGEARSRFMAAVAHDLGAPLGVIRGTLQMLDGDPEVVSVLHRNVERLAAMAGQLSELSRLERGVLQLRRVVLDLAEAVPDVVGSLGPQLDAVEVKVDVDGEVEVDRLAFERSLINLLGNAVGHTPEGTTVAVASHREGDLLVLSVSDEGPGVPEGERELIFDEFRQGRRHSGSGLGLGLSIVRNYARAHGGDAWVEDAPGGGARFCVSWPTPGEA